MPSKSETVPAVSLDEAFLSSPPELRTTTATTTIATTATSPAPICQMRRLRRCFLRSSASRSSRCLRASSRCSFLEANRLSPLCPGETRQKPTHRDEGFVTRCLEARRVARHEARVRPAVHGLPTGPALGAARVEAQARHDHERVAVVGEDRDPAAAAWLAPLHEAGGVERTVEQARARERKRDRSRAVIAAVAPGTVPTAPLVGLG